MTRWLGWFIGIENATAIDQIDVSLAAAWAQEGLFWVVFGCAALVALSITFYLQYQPKSSRASRLALGFVRGLSLCLLFLTLADPVARVTVTNEQEPTLYLVFDGTDSMSIQDEWTAAQRAEFAAATGEQAGGSTHPSTRIDYVKALLEHDDGKWLKRLADERHAKVEAFVFDGATTSQLRKLATSQTPGGKLDAHHLAEQLTTKGQVTALGSVLNEVNQQFGSSRLAGVVLFSDFAHNAGEPPVGDGAAAEKLSVPVYAVGLGATESIDLAVDLQTDLRMKKAERSTLTIKLRQSGLNDQPATVSLIARRLSGEAAGEGQEIKLGEKTLTLASAVESVEFPYTPDESGRFEFLATVEKLPGEIVDQNNRSSRQVNIIDDFLRLMYVANEPSWEWRFVKEVFHRDKLVGMQGFRTYLGSSDPRVRESNVLFLPTLTPKRSEFFANDVLFLDDMPRAALTDRFCEMVKEYVSNLGGGLVVIAGPHYGPRELQGTALADMLPVILDPLATFKDVQEFRPRLTPHAPRYTFMQLGASDAENARAWENLGKLPWYQPVAALHDQAFALAEHPTDKCADGKTPQPIIAIRQYGKGEVVYLGMNEMWRLRKRYGEKYYRQFWSQLIYRLGMSHALGNEKRFVARLDQQQYRVEDKVTLTVEAFSENYEPLTDENLADRTLAAEMTLPGTGETRLVNVPMLKPGVFEVRLPVFEAGEYSLRVKDPITSKYEERRFEVTGLSAERRQGVRNERLQTDLAQQTGGRAYDLTTVKRLPDDIRLKPITETLVRNYALWSTPLWFTLVVGLLLSEWTIRKLLRLT